jgi:small conductance mechanosensitive channel
MLKFLENIDWQAWGQVALTRGLRVGLVLVLAFIAYRVVVIIVSRVQKAVEDDDPTSQSEVEKRAETLSRIVRQVSLIVLALVAGMLIMKEFGFEIGPLLAGAGIAGLAVGFGAQNLVRDLITGFFLLFENQIRVGDVVQVAGKAGLVEALNLRTTVLRDLEGNVHVIPNGSIETVTNMTLEWSRALLDVGVAYKENVDRVMEALGEIGASMEKDSAWQGKILEPLEILGVNEFADSSVNIRILFKTRPRSQWEVGRELRRRIKNRFDELGIEIPFPHVTLYAGEGAQGMFRHRLMEAGPEAGSGGGDEGAAS